MLKHRFPTVRREVYENTYHFPHSRKDVREWGGGYSKILV